MLFKSFDKDNLERFKVRREIGRISVEAYEANLFSEILKIEKKIPTGAKVKFSKQEIDVSKTDIPEYQSFLIFYYESDETNAEYKERIALFEADDIRCFLNLLANVESLNNQKLEIKKLFDKVLKRLPHFAADWQKVLVERFFNEITHNDSYKKGYKEGKEAGKKEFLDLTHGVKTVLKKLKNYEL